MARIDEVAAAAGVSISTVSYALSGKRPISPDTRRRVIDAAHRLGYAPNAGARMLAGRLTHIFALTEPLRRETHAPTHMSFVLAAAVAARRHDYDILLLTDQQASAGMQRVTASGLVDAILVLDVAPDDERVAIARSITTPTVFIGIPDDHEGLDCVDLDFEAAARRAVDRVADAGHRRIALIGQPASTYRLSNFPPRVRRAVAEHAAHRALEHSFATTGEVVTDADAVRAAVNDALDAGATALLLHGVDDMHAAVLAALAERGAEVGADVSIVSIAASFDTTKLPTQLDTIPLIPEASCDLAVDLALARIDDPRRPAGIHLLAPVYRDAGSVTTPPHA
ncbi:LacI family DNA-binding transcriptional regulator [Microbacterium hominis]|uniref:LacI family DNA-binding transcriptional regulator n=1 Tax=Microbacterium TaxID=33882 RepID=UPI00168BE6CB|nr:MULTISPECIES: LacI family DNA-binding transcriptional regulator [Microbacterium]QOC26315.1 LacI family DNA-binding transcriptional regulator [Microbacterium hominis]QOC30260.1 LacI family DNA-binding transcriptional regulator [Microbacterium hominis]QYF97380.1 LacI family transcriptional regulator [Microbacterium sp. PAMC21962]